MEKEEIAYQDHNFDFVVFYNKLLNKHYKKIRRLLALSIFLTFFLFLSILFNFVFIYLYL